MDRWSEYGPETYGERVADVYDEWYRLPDEEAECALPRRARGRWPRARARHRHRPGRAPARGARRRGARHRRVAGDGRAAAREAGRRRDPGDDRRHGRRRRSTASSRSCSSSSTRSSCCSSQEEQVRCFRNVAAHLAPGGRFLLHAFVPDTSRIERGQDLSVPRGRTRPRPPRRHRRTTRSTQTARHDAGAHHRGRHPARPREAAVRVPARARPDGAARRARARVTLGFVRARAVHRRQRVRGLGLPPRLNPAVDHDDTDAPTTERADDRERGEGARRQLLGRRCRRRGARSRGTAARSARTRPAGRSDGSRAARDVVGAERLQLVGGEQHDLGRSVGEALHHRVRGVLPAVRVGRRGVLRERGVVRRVAPDRRPRTCTPRARRSGRRSDRGARREVGRRAVRRVVTVMPTASSDSRDHARRSRGRRRRSGAASVSDGALGTAPATAARAAPGSYVSSDAMRRRACRAAAMRPRVPRSAMVCARPTPSRDRLRRACRGRWPARSRDADSGRSTCESATSTGRRRWRGSPSPPSIACDVRR